MTSYNALTKILFLTAFLSSSPAIQRQMLVFADQEIGLCCLCGEGCPPPLPERQNMEVDHTGKTCNLLMLEMADPDLFPQGSNQCFANKMRFYKRCCDPTHCPEKLDVHTQNPEDNYEPGPHPHCDLCHNGSFPKKPHTQTAVLGIEGNPTCRDLYYMGRVGAISDQLCNPLQDAFDKPCGCGHTAPVEEGGDNFDHPPVYGCDNDGGGWTGGAAPGQDGEDGEIPPKKEVEEDASKGDSSKAYHDPPRGDLHRRGRKLRGERSHRKR